MVILSLWPQFTHLVLSEYVPVIGFNQSLGELVMLPELYDSVYFFISFLTTTTRNHLRRGLVGSVFPECPHRSELWHNTVARRLTNGFTDYGSPRLVDLFIRLYQIAISEPSLSLLI